MKMIETIFSVFHTKEKYFSGGIKMRDYMFANGWGDELTSIPFEFKGKMGVCKNMIDLRGIFKGKRIANKIYI